MKDYIGQLGSFNEELKVGVVCEYSGEVRNAFTAKGHYAMSCDLLPTEKPGLHYQGDAMDFIDRGWDLIIAHPPCTYLCNSGVRWLYNRDGSKNTERWEKMREAANFFRAILDYPVKKMAIENPIMHKYAKEIIGRGQDQIIQPWQFGHGETKATCLWLKGLPKLTPTNIVDGREARIHKMPPGPERSKLRSKTFPGIAQAFADQWG
jgi:hypothetical protein